MRRARGNRCRVSTISQSRVPVRKSLESNNFERVGLQSGGGAYLHPGFSINYAAGKRLNETNFVEFIKIGGGILYFSLQVYSGSIVVFPGGEPNRDSGHIN